MITDVLVEAADGMDEYLNNPAYDETYSGVTRLLLLDIRAQIAMALDILNFPPTAPGAQ